MAPVITPQFKDKWCVTRSTTNACDEVTCFNSNWTNSSLLLSLSCKLFVYPKYNKICNPACKNTLYNEKYLLKKSLFKFQNCFCYNKVFCLLLHSIFILPSKIVWNIWPWVKKHYWFRLKISFFLFYYLHFFTILKAFKRILGLEENFL